MANPRGNPQNLIPFSSTRQPKPENRGPRKSKLRGFIKENDLNRRDIQIIASQLLDLSRVDLEKLINDKTKPILLIGAAMAMLKDMKNGRTDTIQWLTDRGFGQSTQITESSNVNATPFDMDPEARRAYLDEMTKRYIDERKNQGSGGEVRTDQDQVSGEGLPPAGRDSGLPGETEKQEQGEPSQTD